MKKKVLFYGNCQMGVVSQYFLKNPVLNELFEVIKCDASFSPMDIWRGDESNFAVWTKENQPLQKDFFHIIHEKLKKADFFIFQATDRKCIPELTTKFLCEISNGKNICIPNIRLFIYCNDIIALKPYLEYAQTKVNNSKNAKELVDFLRESDDQELINILEKDYPISTNYMQYRNENAQRSKEDCEVYPLYINMEDFIKENYKSKILALQHNHMSLDYYINLLKKLLENLGVYNHTIDQKYLKVPGEGKLCINPLDFKFFRKYFPDLNIKKPERMHSLESLIEQEFLLTK